MENERPLDFERWWQEVGRNLYGGVSCDQPENLAEAVWLAAQRSNEIVIDVLTFMVKFRQDVPPAPSVPRRGIQELREKLVFEEYHEFRQAMFEQDLVRLADACCDLIYVIVGTALAYGIDLRPIWAAVQRSNMEKMPYDPTFAKKLEEQGITIPLGKVMKPVGWKEPDVAGLIASQVQRGNVLWRP